MNRALASKVPRPKDKPNRQRKRRAFVPVLPIYLRAGRHVRSPAGQRDHAAVDGGDDNVVELRVGEARLGSGLRQA